jgi:hypothetical protein
VGLDGIDFGSAAEGVQNESIQSWFLSSFSSLLTSILIPNPSLELNDLKDMQPQVPQSDENGDH